MSHKLKTIHNGILDSMNPKILGVHRLSIGMSNVNTDEKMAKRYMVGVVLGDGCSEPVDSSPRGSQL